MSSAAAVYFRDSFSHNCSCSNAAALPCDSWSRNSRVPQIIGGDSEVVSVGVKGSLEFSGGFVVIEFVKNLWNGGGIVVAFGEIYGGGGQDSGVVVLFADRILVGLWFLVHRQKYTRHLAALARCR